MPKISIIMPVYNIEKYLAKAIEGILSQTFKDFELIIIDDASTDNTVKIINGFDDNRIILVRNSVHQGLVAQLNSGLKLAKAEFIARMDGDDLHHSERLSIQYNILKSSSNIDIVGSNIIYIDENDNPIIEKSLPEHHSDIEFMMPFIPSVIHGSILVRKSVLDSVNGYDSAHSCEDIDLFLRLLKKGHKFYNVQKPLLYYRILPKSKLYHRKQYNDYYEISKRYITEFYRNPLGNETIDEYNYRMGLVEYYLGKISEARKYFFRCIVSRTISKRPILRYLLPSLVPDQLMKFLRRERILERFNFLVKRLFRIDTNIIVNHNKKE
ncbi:MAG: glycosyltransferase family 2 protein [Ignavibacteria bacterium]